MSTRNPMYQAVMSSCRGGGGGLRGGPGDGGGDTLAGPRILTLLWA